MAQKRIAIFASGEGTNAENIIREFRDSELASVELVLCNRTDAGVLKRAADLNVNTILFNRADLYDNGRVDQILSAAKIDLIVLAGFLWMFPPSIIRKYPGRVINIHPALLPKFGGKGMYGNHVHNAVIAARETESRD